VHLYLHQPSAYVRRHYVSIRPHRPAYVSTHVSPSTESQALLVIPSAFCVSTCTFVRVKQVI
jgi:hypothetical protein